MRSTCAASGNLRLIRGACVPAGSRGGITSVDMRTTNWAPSAVRLAFGTASTPCEPMQFDQGRSALAVLPFTVSGCTPWASAKLGWDCTPAGMVTLMCRIAAAAVRRRRAGIAAVDAHEAGRQVVDRERLCGERDAGRAGVGRERGAQVLGRARQAGVPVAARGVRGAEVVEGLGQRAAVRGEHVVESVQVHRAGVGLERGHALEQFLHDARAVALGEEVEEDPARVGEVGGRRAGRAGRAVERLLGVVPVGHEPGRVAGDVGSRPLRRALLHEPGAVGVDGVLEHVEELVGGGLGVAGGRRVDRGEAARGGAVLGVMEGLAQVARA